MPQGPCPSCNTENFTYFGDIFTVKGNREENSVECRECKAKLVFKAEERSVRAALPSLVPPQPRTLHVCLNVVLLGIAIPVNHVGNKSCSYMWSQPQAASAPGNTCQARSQTLLGLLVSPATA